MNYFIRDDEKTRVPKDTDTDDDDARVRVGALVHNVCRLVALVMTLAVCIMTTLLIARKQHTALNDYSLATINMTGFAKFNAPTIDLVDNTTSSGKARRGLGSIVSSIEGGAHTVASAIESEATSIAGDATSVLGAAGAEVTTIVGEVGDKIEEIPDIIEGLVDKILSSVQTDLNDWIQNITQSLDNLNITDVYALHTTAFCQLARQDNESSCSPLLENNSGSEWNATENNGTVLGFQPGDFIANLLGVFMMPQGVQTKVKTVVDGGANSVEHLVREAKDTITEGAADVLLGPIVITFEAACAMSWILFTALLIEVVLSFIYQKLAWLERLSLIRPAILFFWPLLFHYILPRLATLCLFASTTIALVIWAVASILNIATNVAGISVEADPIVWKLSLSSLLLMVAVTVVTSFLPSGLELIWDMIILPRLKRLLSKRSR